MNISKIFFIFKCSIIYYFILINLSDNNKLEYEFLIIFYFEIL